MDALKPLGLLVAVLVVGSAGAAVLTYTESDNSCQGCRAIGYPVPEPIDSQSAVDGFRRRDSLIAGLQARALGSGHLREESIGSSLRGRNIEAFVLGDADATTAEGRVPEGAVMQNGGIHAREWASPEVVAAVIERIDDRAADGGFYQYLVENLTMVLIPSLNPDGFLQTQRYPTTTLESEDAGDPTDRDPDYPRDGRMRRKNMRDVDEVLDVGGDGMFGVDLNRNNPPRWANSSGTRSSDNPRSIVYHGSGPASEPEILALQAAAAFGPAERLRLYIDSHSFSRVYFAPHTGHARRDANQDRLADVIDDVTGQRYTYLPSGPGDEIGSTDEYFAFTYRIPSYTLEIEPGPSGGTEYGGFGVSHDGFILPASEIRRVREELADAAAIAYYRQAGPPALLAATVTEVGGAPVYAGRWTAVSAAARELGVSRSGALSAGVDYELLLQFNKPMRVRDAAGAAVVNYPGQSLELAPRISLVGLSADGREFSHVIAADASGWLGGGAGRLRYDDDAYRVRFRLPEGALPPNPARLALQVDVQDASGLSLDGVPASVVDWDDGGWIGYDGSVCESQTGGPDRTQRLIDDGSPLVDPGLCGTDTDTGGGSGGGALLGAAWLLLPWLRRATRRGRRSAP